MNYSPSSAISFTFTNVRRPFKHGHVLTDSLVFRRVKLVICLSDGDILVSTFHHSMYSRMQEAEPPSSCALEGDGRDHVASERERRDGWRGESSLYWRRELLVIL